MEKTSKFLSPLITRDGLNYDKPGQWKRDVGMNKLATLAKNLDTSKAKNHPDKLYSVPTPWARLLLFESALYDTDHPAHEEVRNQWRGLLGLIGLAQVLKIDKRLTIRELNLMEEPEGDIRNAFMTLRPQHKKEGGRDLEAGKWNNFGLIFVDNVLLGATSPRTLVFTGIDHTCTSSIPFRSAQGRIIDPAPYYKSNDKRYLSVLKQWVDYLVSEVKSSPVLMDWLGTRPSDPDAQQESRHRQLIEALESWQNDIGTDSSPVTVHLSTSSRLPEPFGFIKHVEKADIVDESDLFFRGRNNLIIGFRPNQSVLIDEHNHQLKNQPIRIYGAQQIRAGDLLPDDLSAFVPPDVKVINDPADLFEDTLIEAEIALNSVTCLSFEGRSYLLPLREEYISYFTDSELLELAQKMKIEREDGTTLRVELKIPLARNRTIFVANHYNQEENIVSNDNLDHPTQELAMWPDFVCPGEDENRKPYFEHYFYYTNDVKSNGQVAFKPITEAEVDRSVPEKGKRWFMSKKPLLGFIGSVGDKKGLIFIKHNSIDPPSKSWKVGVDFGSTHTSVFYREVEWHSDGEWRSRPDAKEINPVYFDSRVKILTVGDSIQIQENFFHFSTALSAKSPSLAKQPLEVAIATQLMVPNNTTENYQDNWLPREGQVFLGSLLNNTPSNMLVTDLKWNLNRNNYATSSFLRSLLVLIEAEAIIKRARVVLVAHAYPTAFPSELVGKHTDEWAGVERVLGIPIDNNPLSEAVAVCRHLAKEQKGKPATNTIALDIGGSTTDIAIWKKGVMEVQESVKMAAGALSLYVESLPGFQEWFVSKIAGEEPFKSYKIISPGYPTSNLKKRYFHAILKGIGESGLLDSFIKTVLASKGRLEVQSFLSPIVYLFSALSYYAGLLTRKTGEQDSDEYYLYFCGKGGQFLRWIPSGERVVAQMFAAGLSGPPKDKIEASSQPNEGTKASSAPNVVPKVSGYPKMEVGRGLLIEKPASLQVKSKAESEGIFEEATETVTVAEEGYGFKWDDNLRPEDLSVVLRTLPQLDKLKEFNHFIKTFSESSLTKGVAEQLQVRNHYPTPSYRNNLKQKYADNISEGVERALVEPLFITEAKVLFEMSTDEQDLFD